MEVPNWIENTLQVFLLKTRPLNQLLWSQTTENTEKKKPQTCKVFSYPKCRKSFSQDLHLSQSALKQIQKTPSFIKTEFQMYQLQYYLLPSSETSEMSHSSKCTTCGRLEVMRKPLFLQDWWMSLAPLHRVDWGSGGHFPPSQGNMDMKIHLSFFIPSLYSQRPGWPPESLRSS